MKRDVQRSNRYRGAPSFRRGGRRPHRGSRFNDDRRGGRRIQKGRQSNNNVNRRRFRKPEGRRPAKFGRKLRRLGKRKPLTAEQLDNDLDNYYKKQGKGENCKFLFCNIFRQGLFRQ